MPEKITRREDWPERLNDYIESRRDTPFEWGTNDCCMFAAHAIEAMTGENPAAEFVRKYKKQRSAQKIIKDHGGDLAGLICTKLGQEIDPRQAQRGDVMLVQIPTEDRECAAVCLGDVWAAPGQDGLVFGTMKSALTAWRV